MSIFPLISYLLIALLLVSMMAKARPKVKYPMPGKKLKTLPMGLISRFQLQRSSVIALLMGVVFGVSTGWLPVTTAFIVSGIAVITILIPMSYTFTTQGVAIGSGIFYSWNDFSGFIAKEKKLKLTHPSIFGQLTLFIQPAEMSSVLQYVERYIQKSKKTGKGE